MSIAWALLRAALTLGRWIVLLTVGVASVALGAFGVGMLGVSAFTFAGCALLHTTHKLDVAIIYLLYATLCFGGIALLLMIPYSIGMQDAFAESRERIGRLRLASDEPFDG